MLQFDVQDCRRLWGLITCITNAIVMLSAAASAADLLDVECDPAAGDNCRNGVASEGCASSNIFEELILAPLFLTARLECAYDVLLLLLLLLLLLRFSCAHALRTKSHTPPVTVRGERGHVLKSSEPV
jgi:hypothetical protein